MHKEQKYLKRQLAILRESFGFRKIFVTYVLDLLFYFALVTSFFLWVSVLKSKASSLGFIDYSKIITNDLAAATANFNLLKSFLLFLICSIVIFLLLVLVEFTLFKGLIWSRLLAKRISLSYFGKLLWINFVFLVPVSLLELYVIIKLRNLVVFVIIGLFILHFNALLLYFFTKKSGMLRTFQETFWKGLKFHRFFFPYALMAMVILPVRFLVIPKMAPPTALIFLIVFVLPFISLARNYFVVFMEKS